MIDKFKRSEYKKYYIFIAIIVLVFILLTGWAYSKSNEERIKNRNINVLVRTDGSVYVEDIWDINIVNSSTLYQSFDNANENNFKDIKLSFFDDKTNQWIPLILNEDITFDGRERLDYYHAGYFQGDFEIAWGVGLEGSRARRKYKIEYTVNGAITNYLDTAEYYHMFVGKNFALPIENFEALISFPAPLREESSHIWGHGAPSGSINFKDGKVHAIAKNIPERTFVEVRTLFPKEIVYMADEVKQEMKENILREEEYNTLNTRVARINDVNRQSYINKAQAAIILLLAIVILYEVLSTLNLKKKYPKSFVREWDRYTDLPQTKLDIIAANLIYKDKGSKNFLITVLMKLVHNGYIEIIETNNNLSQISDIKSTDEEIMERTKIIEKLATESNINVNTIEIAKIYTTVMEDIRKKQAKELGLKVKDINKVKYKLNLKKIDIATEENLLEADEKMVLDYFTNMYNREIYMRGKFKDSLNKALRKNKSSLNQSLFIEANKVYAEEIEINKGIIFIEQYQLVESIVKKFDKFEIKYNKILEKTKTEKANIEIYSTEKENRAKKLIYKPVVEILVLVLLVNQLLTQIVGTLQFNESKYMQMYFYTIIAALVLIFINKTQYKTIFPFLKEKGLNIRAEYKGLYNFLSNDSFIAEYPEESIIIWGEFLVLATYFGVADKVLKTLRKTHPIVVKEMTTYSYLDSYYLWNTLNTVNVSQRHFNAIAAGKIISTGASMVSSGGGGGFTSGGGGGFGGGGGGSR